MALGLFWVCDACVCAPAVGDDAASLPAAGTCHRMRDLRHVMCLTRVDARCPCAQMLYYSTYIILAVAGSVANHFFFAFHLIDIVVRYKSLTLVLQAVIRRAPTRLLRRCLSFGC